MQFSRENFNVILKRTANRRDWRGDENLAHLMREKSGQSVALMIASRECFWRVKKYEEHSLLRIEKTSREK